MKQSGLNHLIILSAYKNQLDQLDPTKIASDFANKNDAHKHFLFVDTFCWSYSMVTLNSLIFAPHLFSRTWSARK